MKAILLLHGFKRNGEDDFGQVHDFFLSLGVDKVYAEEWFDNYDKKTMTLKYFEARTKEIAKKILNDGVTELKIVTYSTGVMLTPNICNILKNIDIKIYSIVPPIKIPLSRWVSSGFNSLKIQKKLKKKMGKERYKRLKTASIENRTREKYPIRISVFINEVRMRQWKKVIANPNIEYLISRVDEFIDAEKVEAILTKNKRKITVREFSHAEALKRDKEVALEWLKEVMK